jgi:hypothetical protein
VKAPLEWWEELDFLVPAARIEFGRLMEQLDRGLKTTSTHGPTDNPSGWAGVSRRGPWDRLVPAEWALAEACPEEFVRRADEGELAFWEVGREPSDATRSVWVWVDAGPDQLGACRVVQIALLLWLQKQCLGSGGEFYWGIIQSPEKGYERLRAEELKTFLAARSVDPPRRPPERVDGLQTWCLGAPHWMTQVPHDVIGVTLQQSSHDSVALRAFGRRLELRLPTQRKAIVLLRDPLVWKLSTKPKTMSAPQGRVTFSTDGKKIMVATEQVLTLLPIPSSVNEPLGKPRTYRLPWEGEVIALSMTRRAINLVQARDDKWVFSRLNPSETSDEKWATMPPLERSDKQLGSCWKSGHRWHLWLEDSYYEVIGGKVHTIGQTRGGCHLGSASILATDKGTLINSNQNILYSLGEARPLQVFLARSHKYQVKRLGYAVTYQINANLWRLLYQEQSSDLKVDGEVVGLFCDYERNIGPILVVTNDGLMRLQGPRHNETLDLAKAVKDCRVHPNGLLAFQLESGELGCYDLEARTRLWLAQP